MCFVCLIILLLYIQMTNVIDAVDTVKSHGIITKYPPPHPRKKQTTHHIIYAETKYYMNTKVIDHCLNNVK